jgi:hypothetical protein
MSMCALMLMAVCALTFLVMALSSTKSANGGVRTILVMFELRYVFVLRRCWIEWVAMRYMFPCCMVLSAHES